MGDHELGSGAKDVNRLQTRIAKATVKNLCLLPAMVKKCLSRMSGKLSCTVLRRGKGSNPFPLVDYTSNAVMGLLKQYGLCQSFSLVGMPADSAWVESFFATMKKELIHRTHYETNQSVKEAVFEYVYCFYNVKRIQKKLGYMSPGEYLRSCRKERLAAVA